MRSAAAAAVVAVIVEVVAAVAGVVEVAGLAPQQGGLQGLAVTGTAPAGHRAVHEVHGRHHVNIFSSHHASSTEVSSTL